MSVREKGFYLAFFTALISGVSIFVNKFAVDLIHPPLLFTATKNTWVGLMIFAILLLSRKRVLLKKLSRREIFYLVLIGIIGGSIPFYLFFTGLSIVPAVNAAIIQKTMVFWVALLALPLLKEKLSPLQFSAVAVLFVSNLLVGGFRGFRFSAGEMMILASTLFWAAEIILAKKVLKTVDPDIVTAARMGFGSLILMAAVALTVPGGIGRSLALSFSQWMWMMVTTAALLAYVMSWYRALRLAPATTVTAVLVASTLVTNVLSAIFVTHAWTEIMGAQTVLMLSGVGLFWQAAKQGTSKTFVKAA